MDKIRIKKGVKGGPYVEFLEVECGETYRFWDERASYLEDGIYEVFSDCFQSANDHFNYYGSTKYTKVELEKLLQFLEINREGMQAVTTWELFREYLKTLSMGTNFVTYLKMEKIDPSDKWNEIKEDILRINDGLIDIVKNCLDNNKVLWVVGV